MGKTALRRSERAYGFLLKLYPEDYRQEFGTEMAFVFAESLKDASTETGPAGVVRIWNRTIVDTGKSLVIQHLENRKGTNPMESKGMFITKNKDIVAVVGGTVFILLIPLVAMQFNTGVNWNWVDFATIAALLLAIGFVYVFISRKVTSIRNRILIGAVLVVVLLYTWAELAVGIFTNLGS